MLPSSNLLATSVVFLSASLLFLGHGVWASQLQEMEKPGKNPTQKIPTFNLAKIVRNCSKILNSKKKTKAPAT